MGIRIHQDVKTIISSKKIKILHLVLNKNGLWGVKFFRSLPDGNARKNNQKFKQHLRTPNLNNATEAYLMKKIFCAIFGHHYSVSKRVTHHIKEYKCVHCDKEVTTDASGNLSLLTPENKEINNTLEDLFQKRHGATQRVA